MERRIRAVPQQVRLGRFRVTRWGDGVQSATEWFRIESVALSGCAWPACRAEAKADCPSASCTSCTQRSRQLRQNKGTLPAPGCQAASAAPGRAGARSTAERPYSVQQTCPGNAAPNELKRHGRLFGRVPRLVESWLLNRTRPVDSLPTQCAMGRSSTLCLSSPWPAWSITPSRAAGGWLPTPVRPDSVAFVAGTDNRLRQQPGSEAVGLRRRGGRVAPLGAVERICQTCQGGCPRAGLGGLAGGRLAPASSDMKHGAVGQDQPRAHVFPRPCVLQLAINGEASVMRIPSGSLRQAGGEVGVGAGPGRERGGTAGHA
jgi:hypothetical protein